MKGGACDDCLRRTDLVAALAGRIEVEWRRRSGRPRLLALSDEALLDWGGDAGVRRRYERFDASAARERVRAARLATTCRCSTGYPRELLELVDPPAVLHRTVGGAAPMVPAADAVAVVGARQASPYGPEVARGLSRGLAAAGVLVVSGMALGIDSAAHAGALEAGPTLAVLASGADVPYPRSGRRLYERVREAGAVVSEMPPGTAPYRWSFPARNRIIAALSAGTVVVEAGERSGSLITADFAAELGRFVAAVPGPVAARTSAGANVLLKSGAELVRHAQDVLELLYGVGAAAARAEPAPTRAAQPALAPALRRVLERVEQGQETVGELADSAEAARQVTAALGELELLGLVRRTFGGRYVRAA